MPLHKAGNGEAMGSASASDGTYPSQGVQTPENASLSHSTSMQMLAKSDMAWAGTDGDTDATPSTPGLPPPKSSELVALEALLGRFPQQQKELLQDISARVAKTPKMDKREDGIAAKTSQAPDQAHLAVWRGAASRRMSWSLGSLDPYPTHTHSLSLHLHTYHSQVKVFTAQSCEENGDAIGA